MVVVNDIINEDLKLPVFMMNAILFLSEFRRGKCWYLPKRNVDSMSKRCFYKRITKSKKKYLAKSRNSLGYFSSVSMIIGTEFDHNEIVEIWMEQSFFGSPVALMPGIRSFIVPFVIMLLKLI